MLVLWEEVSVSRSDLGNNSEVVFSFVLFFTGYLFFLFLFPADGWYFWKSIFSKICQCVYVILVISSQPSAFSPTHKAAEQ